MFCKKCGKQIPDESIFCMFCGASIKEGTNSTIQQESCDNAIVSCFKHLYANTGCLGFTISVVIMLIVLFYILGFISFFLHH